MTRGGGMQGISSTRCGETAMQVYSACDLEQL